MTDQFSKIIDSFRDEKYPTNETINKLVKECLMVREISEDSSQQFNVFLSKKELDHLLTREIYIYSLENEAYLDILKPKYNIEEIIYLVNHGATFPLNRVLFDYDLVKLLVSNGINNRHPIGRKLLRELDRPDQFISISYYDFYSNRYKHHTDIIDAFGDQIENGIIDEKIRHYLRSVNDLLKLKENKSIPVLNNSDFYEVTISYTQLIYLIEDIIITTHREGQGGYHVYDIRKNTNIESLLSLLDNILDSINSSLLIKSATKTK